MVRRTYFMCSRCYYPILNTVPYSQWEREERMKGEEEGGERRGREDVSPVHPKIGPHTQLQSLFQQPS